MYFVTLELSNDGVVTATAKGHPTDVMIQFHEVSRLLLHSRGAWRITKVEGKAPPEVNLDSDMKWKLVATAKDRGV